MMLPIRNHLLAPTTLRFMQCKNLKIANTTAKSAKVDFKEIVQPFKKENKCLSTTLLQEGEEFSTPVKKASAAAVKKQLKVQEKLDGPPESLSVSEHSESPQDRRAAESEIKGYLRSSQYSLTSITQATVFSLGLDRAVDIIVREGKRRNCRPVTLIDAVNHLLMIISQQENFEMAEILMDTAFSPKFTPCKETFGLWMICLQNAGKLGDPAVRENLLQKLQKYNVSLEDIWANSLMTHNSIPALFEAIRTLDPTLSQKFQEPEFRQKRQLWYRSYDDKNPLYSDLDQKIHNSKPKTFMNEEEMRQAVDDQYQARQDMTVNLTHYINDLMSNKPTAHNEGQQLLNEWEEILNEKTGEFLVGLKKDFDDSFNKNFSVIHAYPCIASLTLAQLRSICLKQIHAIVTLDQKFCSVFFIHASIGKLVNDLVAENYQKRDVDPAQREAVKEYCCSFLKGGDQDIPRVRFMDIMYKHDQEREFVLPSNIWNISIKSIVGKAILNFITNSITVKVPKNRQTIVEPAFYAVTVPGSGVSIECHPKVKSIFEENGVQQIEFPVESLPSLCPPIPWVFPEARGKLIQDQFFLRTTRKYEQYDMIKNEPLRNLYAVLDSLNLLGSVPWRINSRLLDIIVKIFKEGGNLELGIAPKAKMVKPLTRQDFEELSYMERQHLIVEHTRIKSREGGYNSQRYDAAYKLACAQRFRDRVFWLPTDLDFRGRAYPIPPHLTHVSSDIFRSLMLFAEGHELGVKGLQWLKIHVINLTGLQKKNSLAERLQFFEDNVDAIMESADNPINGKGWWLTGDDPWQTLAACMEVTNALRSPDPEKFVSHLPIHQDGSCNGLQHYAALGRDIAGAVSVNLSDAERPADVYTAIALRTEQFRKEEAEKGCEVSRRLEGYISRKVVKQTIMTSVYGVTNYGAIQQVMKKLGNCNIEPRELRSCSSVVVNYIFKALRSMFTSTKEIQRWFGQCSDHICINENRGVQWITPLGLPICQPYFKETRKLSNSFRNRNVIRTPVVSKHKNAFPPNFIHSLDSSHMMLTGLRCQQNGLTFTSIHDCFWTHAKDVDKMNQYCREEFVSLHSQPILEDLASYFKTHFGSSEGSNIFDKVPLKGNFEIEKVLKSRFFFS